MPGLPHGWRMRNSEGEILGPPIEDDAFHSGDEAENDLAEPLDIRPDSEGWNDINEDDDTEGLSIQCLLCDSSYPDANSMLGHCKATHDFDFLKIQKQHNLDFYATMKLINYIRTEVLEGKQNPNVQDPASWADDRFLQPALQDDALLFTIDDVIDAPAEEAEQDPKMSAAP